MVNIRLNRTLQFAAGPGSTPIRFPSTPCRYVVIEYQSDSIGNIHGVDGSGVIDTTGISLQQGEKTPVIYCDNLNQLAYSAIEGDTFVVLVGA